MSSRTHGLRVLATAFVVTVVAVVLFAWHTAAAATYRASVVVTSVARDVTIDAVVVAQQDTTVDYAGVCFSDADGRAVDFPLHEDVRLTAAGVPLASKGTLAAGRYLFSVCVRIGGSWSSVGSVGSIDVVDDGAPRTVSMVMTTAQAPLATTLATTTDAATNSAATNSAATNSAATNSAATNSATSASGQGPATTASPTSQTPSPARTTADVALPLGDLPGWRQIFTEDFTTPSAVGKFPGRAYRDRWFAYDGFTNPSGIPLYDTRNVTSVHDGLLDVRVSSEDGTARGAGVVALFDGKGSWGGRTYGRYAVRFRFDPTPEWGAALLLWSDRNEWHDGEIDFAEGASTGTIGSYNHRLDRPAENALAVETEARWNDWHVATVEWTASGVTFLMDGQVTGRSTTSPSNPMHLVIQTIRTTAPLADETGHLQVDWVAAWELA